MQHLVLPRGVEAVVRTEMCKKTLLLGVLDQGPDHRINGAVPSSFGSSPSRRRHEHHRASTTATLSAAAHLLVLL